MALVNHSKGKLFFVRAEIMMPGRSCLCTLMHSSAKAQARSSPVAIANHFSTAYYKVKGVDLRMEVRKK